MSKRALVVEDDANIAELLRLYLGKDGFDVMICADGARAESTFDLFSPDVMLLDLMLPGKDGLQICRDIRKKSSVPIIMLTAKGETSDKITGLDVGADDYVTKPFKMQILLKRVEALLRRSGALAKEIRVGRLTLLPEDFTVLCDGTELPLTRKEFEILLLLVQNKGRTLTHEIILSRIWGYDFEGDGSTVHTHIKNLRAKLPENIIKTIRGVGYRLEES